MILLRRIIMLGVFVLLLVAGWRFAAFNAQPIKVHYLFGSNEAVMLWQVLLISFLSGALIVGIIASISRVRSGILTRRYRKTIAALEEEVHQLRNLPLAVETSHESGAGAEGSGQDG
jgi:uncharacterized integral membrane protein